MWARRLALFAGVAAIAAGGALALAGPLTVTAVGGLEGTRYIEHPLNDVYEPTELVSVEYSTAVNPESFKAAITITPASPFSVYPVDYYKRQTIRFVKKPGATYQVHIAPGVRAIDGSITDEPLDITVKTANDPIPAPLRATPNEPYRYGVLAHPFPPSLTGPDAAKLVAEFADAGVRFVRIDYCGAQSELQAGKYDWSIEDHIADMLAARGITELPIVEQYCAPPWATGGSGYPAIWQNPGLYADFAAAVALHVAQRYPRITRLELFNEPNLHGWWTNKGDPAFAAIDGSATAAYMLAAYSAVKRVASRLTVVGPALASGGHEVDPRTFFENMYANGCKRGACWDVLSVHNYRWENPTFPESPSASNRFDIYKAILDIAAKHGDPNTHVMLTEWGYSTLAVPEGVDPQTQARYVALGFNEMLADPDVDGIVYVNMYNPATDFWGNTALVYPDFVPKPAYYVYRGFARGRG